MERDNDKPQKILHLGMVDNDKEKYSNFLIFIIKSNLIFI